MAYIPFNLLNRNMHAVSIYLIFVEKNVNLHCSTITKKMSFLQTLISLRPSKNAQMLIFLALDAHPSVPFHSLVKSIATLYAPAPNTAFTKRPTPFPFQ